MYSTAPRRFALAVVNLAVRGQRPRCGEPPNLWLSEDRSERAQAARLCTGCPVFNECASSAGHNRPTFGVWAGRDWTDEPRRDPTRAGKATPVKRQAPALTRKTQDVPAYLQIPSRGPSKSARRNGNWGHHPKPKAASKRADSDAH